MPHPGIGITQSRVRHAGKGAELHGTSRVKDWAQPERIARNLTSLVRWPKVETSVQYRLGFAAIILGLILGVSSQDALAADSPAAGLDEAVILIPHPMTMLLHAESVHGELDLNGEQKATIETAADQVDLPLWRMRDLPLGERNHRARALLDSLRARLAATLTERQCGRFDQLVLRALGLLAILEPEMKMALDLSNDQQEKIQAAIAPLTRNGGSENRLRAAVERSTLALLSDRQRRRFEGLMGPSFNFSTVRAAACKAPAFDGVTVWINSPPLTWGQLRGRVVIVHFYTFGCVNCVRNLPHYNDWHKGFDPDRLAIVGIHRPETRDEHDTAKVRQKAAEAGLEYAIAVDNESCNWDAWANRIWPSVYLIDKNGFVRYWWYGELNWQGMQGEKWIRDRIAEMRAEPYGKAAAPRTREPRAAHP